jgi:hypothetical protein
LNFSASATIDLSSFLSSCLTLVDLELFLVATPPRFLRPLSLYGSQLQRLVLHFVAPPERGLDDTLLQDLVLPRLGTLIISDGGDLILCRLALMMRKLPALHTLVCRYVFQQSTLSRRSLQKTLASCPWPLHYVVIGSGNAAQSDSHDEMYQRESHSKRWTHFSGPSEQ